MFDSIISAINAAQKIVVIQAENPDGDSLGSSVALEAILSDIGKEVTMFCAIDVPKYMHYIKGWDRVEKDWPNKQDLAIIVDTSSKLLMEKTIQIPAVRNFLETHEVIVIDHHKTTGDLPFTSTDLIDSNAVATSEIIFELANEAGWAIPADAAEAMFTSIQADSLGLTTPSTTTKAYRTAAELVALGANPHEIENRRREFMKKPADILEYKGRLIGRIEYNLDGKLATVHIPWSEIEEYSDRYNPSVLVLEEMRLVEGVEVAIALKTYPDGKLTGKVRSNAPISHHIAGFFGGGGHEYSAGFKLFENYDTIMQELLKATSKALDEHDATHTQSAD